ncbi:Ecr family regulatory small membrane protein [Trabulsiella odontotermitis]|nr:Ecr family regulatory small membrane protein [Trabulsiella odontotermitis]
MSKMEIVLLLLVLVILIFGIWFIFSDTIWVAVSAIESRLYPAIVAPE